MKTWFITGISSGIGKALATEVMNNGDYVIGTFRRQDQVDHFNTDNKGKGEAILLDITHHDQVDNVIKELVSTGSSIDVLVNNAGVGGVGAIEETSIQEVRDIMEVNFFSAYKITQAVLPHMRKNRAGHIIQISSHGGIKAFAGFGVYNASKFALEGMSEALAQEVGPLGIHVTLVEPGPFRTNFAGDGLLQAETKMDDYDNTAGSFRTKLKGVHQKQEGSPVKAAQAIYSLTKMEQPPLRQPLGKIALVTIGMKLDNVRQDLVQGAEIAKAAVYEE